MTEAERIQKILSSHSIEELQSTGVLPDPYDDSGYYLVYYAEADYKFVLPEIVAYMESGLRIYYDRYLERGSSHLRDFTDKAFSTHCRCIVFYLSDAVFADPTFLALVEAADQHRLPVMSINRGAAGRECSGLAMAKAAGVTGEALAAIARLFPDEITYVPFSLPTEEKKRELRHAYETNAMRYTLCGDFAVAEYVKDLSEVEITVLREVEIGGVKYPVRAVAARAFADCRDLKRVILPDTVEEIGFECENPSAAGVFENCEQLEEVVFPPHVKCIYGGMFSGCASLKRLIFNESAVFAGKSGTHFCFRQERGTDLAYTRPLIEEESTELRPEGYPLEELALPRACRILFHTEGHVRFCYETDDGVAATYLVTASLQGGTENSLPEEMNEACAADYYLFAGREEIKRVAFDKDCYCAPKWIRTFYRCSELQEVVLPNTVLELESVFTECEKLERVILPESLISIGSESFASCRALREITLPRYLYHVDMLAFRRDTLDVVVSDSLYSKNIFKNGYREDADHLYIKSKVWRAVYRWLVKVMTHLFIRGTSRQRPFTWWCRVKTLYITDRVKPFRMDGYREVISDRDGYRRYDCCITQVDRLKFMEKMSR